MHDINVTPLIDIVFNLLIFFLITTTFVQNPGIEVDLPKASDAPVQPNADSVIIAVTAEGRLIHEGKAVCHRTSSNSGCAPIKVRPTALVIIQADATTQHGKVVEVMDLAQRAGFTQLAIATDTDQ